MIAQTLPGKAQQCMTSTGGYALGWGPCTVDESQLWTGLNTGSVQVAGPTANWW